MGNKVNSKTDRRIFQKWRAKREERVARWGVYYFTIIDDCSTQSGLFSFRVSASFFPPRPPGISRLNNITHTHTPHTQDLEKEKTKLNEENKGNQIVVVHRNDCERGPFVSHVILSVGPIVVMLGAASCHLPLLCGRPGGKLVPMRSRGIFTPSHIPWPKYKRERREQKTNEFGKLTGKKMK